MNPLQPSPVLLIKLGSLLIHYQEKTSDDGHLFDQHAIDAIENDPEFTEWICEMNRLALLPVKRKGVIREQKANLGSQRKSKGID